MQFSTAITEVARQLNLDETETATETNIKRWLNMTQQDIAGFWDWSWLQDRESVTMAPDYTSGTVALTAGSATITFSAGPTASQANRYIQFSSYSDWYKITAHTAGATSATIDPAYIQSSDAPTETLTIRTKFYSMSSTTEKIYSCREATNQRKLRIVNASEADTYIPFSTATGTPTDIYVWGRDSNNYVQFTPYPWPDAALLLEFRVYKSPTDLSSSTDTPIFPTRFDSMWIEGALIYGHRYMDDTREGSVSKSFWGKLEEMKKHDKPDKTKHRVLRAIDEHETYRTVVPFPPEYGDVR